MNKVLELLKMLFSYIVSFFKKKDAPVKLEVSEEKAEDVKTESKKYKVLSPLRHKRYISMYCIADLVEGSKTIKDVHGNIIASISIHSYKRLIMEGTGKLESGEVVNVDTRVNGVWTFRIMGPDKPYGLGIKGSALAPWKSLAHQLSQLNSHQLFNRKVVIPSLYGYTTPEGKVLTGEFEVHDTGGGLRRCPFEKGLWRTGPSKNTYGQFDLFVGSESTYKKLLSTWNSYRDVIVMPRSLDSVIGRQEAINLLLDEGLTLDGIEGPNTKKGIEHLQVSMGMKETGEWDEFLEEYVRKSLDNWR